MREVGRRRVIAIAVLLLAARIIPSEAWISGWQFRTESTGSLPVSSSLSTTTISGQRWKQGNCKRIVKRSAILTTVSPQQSTCVDHDQHVQSKVRILIAARSRLVRYAQKRSSRALLASFCLLGLVMSCAPFRVMAVTDPSSIAATASAAGESLASSAAAASTAPIATTSATAASATVATARAAEIIAAAPVSADVELRLSLRLLYASLLGACLGKERSSASKHSAGVRTMSLVSMGASAFTVCSAYGFLAFSHYDPSRMASNVASGVGFVGAGVITTTMSDRSQNVVHGLTTAAAIWLSAAVGVACGVGLFRVATTASFTTIAILRLGRSNPKRKDRGSSTTSSLGSMTPSDTTQSFLSRFQDDRQRAESDTHDTSVWDESGLEDSQHLTPAHLAALDQDDARIEKNAKLSVEAAVETKNPLIARFPNKTGLADSVGAKNDDADTIVPLPIIAVDDEEMQKVLGKTMLAPLKLDQLQVLMKNQTARP